MRLPAAPTLPVRTGRLALRGFRRDDLQALHGIHSDPSAVRYVPFPPRDRDGTAAVLERKIGNRSLSHDGDLLELAVTPVGTGGDAGPLIGDVLLILRSAQHQTLEVGYLFSPRHGGQGYATEAVRALLGIAFDVVGARRVVARVDARNVRSRALAERIGMRTEAHLVENEWVKGELTSEVDYAMLSREWPRA